ncbi:MAG: glycerophosphodiester phosphodiesterase [Gemmatimonadaceae bacterium]
MNNSLTISAVIALSLIQSACRGSKVAEPAAAAKPVVVAHRGSSYAAPEHTLAAYDLAISDGADFIEQDVQRTRDGVLVVIHDATLDRTASGEASACTGAVAEKTLAELKTCDAGSWFNARNPTLARSSYVGLRIPTLAEVLDRYGSRARYYIEIKDPDKYPGIEAGLISLLNDHGIGGATAGPPRVLIQSFNASSLHRVRELNPRLVLVQLVGDLPGSQTLDSLDAIRLYASGVGPHRADVDRAFVDAAHARGLLVHPYTVDDPAEMSSLLGMGVDGMFTNRPALLKEIISSR